MTKKLIILGASLAVLAPIVTHIINVDWANSSLMQAIFPIFGLLAFTLLWLHAMSGVFEEWLRERFDFDFFVHWTSIVILFSIILHPLFLLIIAKFDILGIYNANPKAMLLAFIGLPLLLTYDIGKLLKTKKFFPARWNAILMISTIGFILIFFHSLQIGSDLQSGFLRKLWIFYGVTAILATIYTYGIKKLLR